MQTKTLFSQHYLEIYLPRRPEWAGDSQFIFRERLRECNASLAKLLPLKYRLAATDRLIDLIVYWLHGLTEEDVGIVEGSAGL